MSRRLILAFLAVAILTLAMLELPLGFTFASKQEQAFLSAIERDASSLADQIEEGFEGSTVPTSLQAVAVRFAAETGGRAVVVNRNGICIADSTEGPGESYANRPEIQSALSGRIVSGRRASDTAGTDLLVVAVPMHHDGDVIGAVRVTYPRSELDRAVRNNWLRLFVLSFLVLCSVSFFGWMIAKWATRPIRAVEHTALQLAQGRLSSRAPTSSGPPEVRSLASVFNSMAEQNQRLIDSQRRLVADASHQLRTPLTALSLRLEALGDAIDTTGSEVAAVDATRNIAGAEAEVARLTELVEGLLRLSRAEAPARLEPTELLPIVAGREAIWGPVADQSTIELVVDVPADLWVAATPGAIEQMLDNLVSNAVTYGGTGTRITISAKLDTTLHADRPSDVVLRVIDNGTGLGDEQKELALTRFWRAPESAPGGTGLGLAIVSTLAHAMDGTLRLIDTDGGGLTAEVRLRHVDAPHKSVNATHSE